MERLCEHCGEPFIPKRADANYCGHSCRQQAYLARKIGQGQNLGNLIFNPLEEEETTEPSIPVTVKEPYLSIKDEKPIQPVKPEPMTDKKLPDYFSNFLDFIDRRITYRNRDSFLSAFEIRYPALSNWINTHCLCLIESLLAVSEMRSVDLDDLKDISNAFHLLLNSETFKNIPVNYPYTTEMNKYYETIRQFCISSQEETVEVKFTRTTKAELLSTRFELVQFVSWVRFDQLNFSE
jgi:hypothetical protein